MELEPLESSPRPWCQMSFLSVIFVCCFQMTSHVKVLQGTQSVHNNFSSWEASSVGVIPLILITTTRVLKMPLRMAASAWRWDLLSLVFPSLLKRSNDAFVHLLILRFRGCFPPTCVHWETRWTNFRSCWGGTESSPQTWLCWSIPDNRQASNASEWRPRRTSGKRKVGGNCF